MLIASPPLSGQDSFIAPERFYNDKFPTRSCDTTLPGVCLSLSSAGPLYHHLAPGLTISADYSHNKIQNTGSRVTFYSSSEAVHLQDRTSTTSGPDITLWKAQFISIESSSSVAYLTIRSETNGDIYLVILLHS